MWPLASDATNASSGSTPAGFEYGTGTTDGEDDAVTVKPPSKVHVCSREYLPFKKSGLVRCHWIVALCSDIEAKPGPSRSLDYLRLVPHVAALREQVIRRDWAPRARGIKFAVRQHLA